MIQSWIMIFHSNALSSNNSTLSLNYEEFVQGCHLDVFASYYESWKYTPVDLYLMLNH